MSGTFNKSNEQTYQFLLFIRNTVILEKYIKYNTIIFLEFHFRENTQFQPPEIHFPAVPVQDNFCNLRELQMSRWNSMWQCSKCQSMLMGRLSAKNRFKLHSSNDTVNIHTVHFFQLLGFIQFLQKIRSRLHWQNRIMHLN